MIDVLNINEHKVLNAEGKDLFALFDSYAKEHVDDDEGINLQDMYSKIGHAMIGDDIYG